ncbi:hypothetical protein EJ07DRAFT_150751 [Lizonia empirigonia]|nr:hypothetical protein EJ07DRAFT_150751 [Lizonia empirigonia]
MSVLTRTDIGKWLSTYRNKPRRHAAAGKPHQGSDECPFTIRRLNKTTHLIREKDRFGEYPHIYVREHTEIYPNGQTARIFIVNDTECGTSTPTDMTQSRNWNIRTFIEHHLNPHGDNILYLVILSHCHYDHILGLEPILRPAKNPNNPQPSQPLIASSSQARTFLEPRSHLKQHSLCTSMNLHCPAYATTFWAAHNQRLTIQHPSTPASQPPRPSPSQHCTRPATRPTASAGTTTPHARRTVGEGERGADSVS